MNDTPAATISDEGLVDIASALSNLEDYANRIEKVGRVKGATEVRAAVETIRESICFAEEDPNA